MSCFKVRIRASVHPVERANIFRRNEVDASNRKQCGACCHSTTCLVNLFYFHNAEEEEEEEEEEEREENRHISIDYY